MTSRAVEWLGNLEARRPAKAQQTLPPRRRKHPDPELPEAQLKAAWQLTSILLSYPDERVLGLLPQVREAASRLPDEVREPLLRLTGYLERTDEGAARSLYVETFDTTRKCALHLTYYSHGDTRKRGVALVQFKQAFRRGGLEVGDKELPDHLSVVLEFGAVGDTGIAWKLLNDHRAGIELLQLGLDAKESPWSDAVVALRATLPPLDGTQEEAVAQLLAEGPPNEDVGLDAYAIDPLLNPHPDDEVALTFDQLGASR